MLFTVETEQETDGRWIAEVLELSGAMKYGRTRDEAIAHAEAIQISFDADAGDSAAGGEPALTLGVKKLRPSSSR
jgi:hypothetical protein